MAEVVTPGEAVAEPGPDWDQGDIVDAVYFAAIDQSAPGVLVTPACDIEQDKVDLWTFVILHPDTVVAGNILQAEFPWLASGGSPTGKQLEAMDKRVRELIGQRYPRYHWLPAAIGACAAHVADFSCVTAVPIEEVKAKSKRVARLMSSWREQVPARYVAYMGRVGTLDFAPRDVAAHVDRVRAAVLAR